MRSDVLSRAELGLSRWSARMKNLLGKFSLIYGGAALLCTLFLIPAPGNSQNQSSETKPPDASMVGQWSAVQNLPYIPVHSIILPNGSLLFYSHFDDSKNPLIWNPVTETTAPAATISYDIF